MYPLAISKALSHKLTNMAFICSVLVVAIYTRGCDIPGTLDWYIRQMCAAGISLIGVPFFFIASGFFLAGHMISPGWWGQACKKRVKTLLIPFFLWQIIFFLCNAPLILTANILAGEALSRNFPTTFPQILDTIGLLPTGLPPMKVLWFVRCLLIFVLLSPCLFAVLRKGKVYALLMMALFYGIYAFTGPYLGWVGFFSISGLFFFTLGIFLRFHPISIKLPSWVTVPTFVLCLLAYLMSAFSKAGVELIPLPKHILITLPLLIWIVWQWVPSKPWNRAITSCAFPIYLLHIFILGRFNLLFENIAVLSFLKHWYGYFIMWFIAVVGSIGITLLMRRWFPKTSDLLFGGR